MIAFRKPVSSPGVSLFTLIIYKCGINSDHKTSVFANICSNCYLCTVQYYRTCGRPLSFAEIVTAISSSLNWLERTWPLCSPDFIMWNSVEFIVYNTPTIALKKQSADFIYTTNTAVIVLAFEITLLVNNQHTGNCVPQGPGSLLCYH